MGSDEAERSVEGSVGFVTNHLYGNVNRSHGINHPPAGIAFIPGAHVITVGTTLVHVLVVGVVVVLAIRQPEGGLCLSVHLVDRNHERFVLYPDIVVVIRRNRLDVLALSLYGSRGAFHVEAEDRAQVSQGILFECVGPQFVVRLHAGIVHFVVASVVRDAVVTGLERNLHGLNESEDFFQRLVGYVVGQGGGSFLAGYAVEHAHVIAGLQRGNEVGGYRHGLNGRKH